MDMNIHQINVVHKILDIDLLLLICITNKQSSKSNEKKPVYLSQVKYSVKIILTNLKRTHILFLNKL